MKPNLALLLSCLIVSLALRATAQQSDYALKKDFDEQYKALFARTEEAGSIAGLDSIRADVDTLELRFSPYAAFLDKALYPETFAEKVRSLRTLHSLTYEKVYLIQTQGVKVEELETKILFLTGRLDTLTAQRDRLVVELQEAKKSNTQYREIVRRLEANLQAKDRLIFALVDSIFVPYEKDTTRISDLQAEAINRKLEKANLLTRVEEIAAENSRFLSVTKLQPKDYAAVIEQYQQFSGRWNGLRDKITAAVIAGSKYRAPSPGVGTTSAKTQRPGEGVDSVVSAWGNRLQTMFWDAIAEEFKDKGVNVDPFHDAQSFSASIRSYIASVKASGQDAGPFVNDVWRTRIDREWRDALTKPSMLGSEQYAALDREVSQLQKPSIDVRFILYSAVVILLAVAGWWFFVRKPKPPLAPPGESKTT